MSAVVVSVGRDSAHRFGKPPVGEITLLEGLGVEGDAHAGATVQHLYDKKRHPDAPNLRQVHLMHSELFDEVAADGFTVTPGDLGENITTGGVDLLGLPAGTLLHLGETAVVELTGVRNPCRQINGVEPGLMKRLIRRGPDGEVERLSGVMSVVRTGGVVRAGDAIRVELPVGEPQPLQPV